MTRFVCFIKHYTDSQGVACELAVAINVADIVTIRPAPDSTRCWLDVRGKLQAYLVDGPFAYVVEALNNPSIKAI